MKFSEDYTDSLFFGLLTYFYNQTEIKKNKSYLINLTLDLELVFLDAYST